MFATIDISSMTERRDLDDVDILGLVPARGGSKGIEKKNIVDVAGQPLISYVLTALEQSRAVDEIVCTTDSEEIASVAREWGAKTPFLRPAEMAADESSIFPALAHGTEQTAEHLDFRADYVVTAQPTYPLVEPSQIDAAVTKVLAEDGDSAITAVELDHDAHPYNIRECGDDGRVQFWNESEHYQYPNRQQKPTFYRFGNVFVTEYDLLVEKERLEGTDNYMVEVDPITTLDVNTPEDLNQVEYHLRRKKDENNV